MKLTLKKLPAIIAALLLAVTGVTVASAPAHAADCPYPVADQSDNDNPKDNIRLISPVLTDDNSVHRQDLEIQFTQDCDWFGVGTRFNQVYVPFGQNVTMTFHATNPAGVPLANTKVKLRGNKGYSGSLAAVRINGVKARPAPSSAADGADVFGNTDAFGNVSFLIASPSDSDCSSYGGSLPKAPANITDPTPHDVLNDNTADCYSQFLPEITGEKTDSADFVEFHYYDASTEDDSVSSATVSALAPVLDETNAVIGDGNTQAYALVGSTQVMAFQALQDDGSYARNQNVKVIVGMSGSNSNAAISAGIYGNASNGAATTLTANNPAGDQLVLTGKTDAFGTVTFLVKNTDTNGEAQPATLTTAPPVTGAKFSRISAALDGISSSGNSIEMHYFKPAPPTAITIAASGRKITVTITNAVGKNSTIAITGSKTVTVKPTKATQVYSYTVAKGSRTVTVVANGKTLTKKFTIK